MSYYWVWEFWARCAESHSKAKAAAQQRKPSLVVCPQILVGHWALEIRKFVAEDVLLPLAYEGSPHSRQLLQKRFQSADVVIMSYETLRADSTSLLRQQWHYCILDEGHVIRNSKSKVSQVPFPPLCRTPSVSDL